MANGWRLARSISRLIRELRRVAPGTRIGTIGDEHHEPPSRHLPGPRDRVRAADIHGNADLNLEWLVERLTATDDEDNPIHPALSYVIYRNRAWSPSDGWHTYHGKWHSHVHVAVSNDRADDTSPWGLTQTKGGDMSILGLSRGDSGEDVELLQALLIRAGFGAELGDFGPNDDGVDGEYGDATAAAVLAARHSVDSEAESGDTVDPYAAAQIYSALAIAQAGGRGDVELPDSVQVSGQLDVET